MLRLDGDNLTIDALADAARGGGVALAPEALARMRASRRLIDQVIAERRPVYGVTTGLGARSGEALDAETLAAFSVQTLRGRAHAVGEDESAENTRAGMIVRLNTLLCGFSGARPEVAEHLAACLNAGLTPVVGRIGSIGVSDLVINATVGLALTGEGTMQSGERTGPAAEMLQAKGIAPLELAPRDGLALANHSGAVAGTAALAHAGAGCAFGSAQTAAALSLEAFRANLSPLDPRALAVKPLPGQQAAAADLTRRLEGSALFDRANARRLQDPLSFRNIAQIHGGVQLALDQAATIIGIEINGSSDNPLALADTGEVLSSGAYFTTELALSCEMVSRAWLHMAMAQIARIAKLLDPAFSDLPLFLAHPDTGSNGFAPLMKTAEAVLADLAQAAQPPAIWPSLNANGVEDCLSTAPVAVRSLSRVVDLSHRLTAIELMVAAQAIELRGCEDRLGAFLGQRLGEVRSLSAALDRDRPLATDVERLASAIAVGVFR